MIVGVAWFRHDTRIDRPAGRQFVNDAKDVLGRPGVENRWHHRHENGVSSDQGASEHRCITASNIDEDVLIGRREFRELFMDDWLGDLDTGERGQRIVSSGEELQAAGLRVSVNQKYPVAL